MDFLTYNDNIITDGDHVVLFLSRGQMYPLTISPGHFIQTVRGLFRHDDMIGREYGTLISNASKKQYFARVLQMSPELWTLTLSHRTQIMYTPDISIIIDRLNLLPGSVAVEAGTGSGSLTHSLARAVAPSGRVFTYEFHEGRAAQALQEFQDHGLSDIVFSGHRDVIENGFLLDNHLSVGQADALFLDVPSPWLCINHVHEVLRDHGIFCSFSPSMEQVQRTVSALSEHQGFFDHEVIAVQCFPYDLKPLTNKKSCRLSERTSKLIEELSDDVSITRIQDEYFVHKKSPTDRFHTGYLLFIKKKLSLS
ncbi:hypothetical protein GEMRC1_002685 [Eukaryota sp. GEM-RC1]